MKKILVLSALLISTAAVMAQQAQSVWRYVDDKTGQIIYSNVQIKGKKGTKMDILEYPTVNPAPMGAPSMVSNIPAFNANAGAPIPEALLRQMQGAQGVAPAISLPPLPTINGAVPVPSTQAPSNVRLAPALPAGVAASKEPNWAKSAPSGASPSWAKDPFEQKSIDSVD